MNVTLGREMEQLERYHGLPRHGRLDGAVRRPVRHGVGHHEQLRSRSPPSKNTTLAVVAPGIAEALFATALGLVAAIPAVLAYNKLSSDLGRYASRLEAFAGEFSAILSRQLEEKRLMAMAAGRSAARQPAAAGARRATGR